jgi:hypothetical protein
MSTPNTQEQGTLERLIPALKDKLKLVECESLERLRSLPDKQVGFVSNCRLRFAGYYDLTSDIVIYDRSGGTLCLVDRLSGNPTEAASTIRRSIDRAAWVRQILIDNCSKPQNASAKSRKLAAQVELVIAVDSATQESKTAVYKALTDIARNTTYLSLIGLSVLWKDFDSEALPRVFPWLLSATKRWFEASEFQHSTEPWKEKAEEVILELNDYRSEGIRRFALHGECNLQLVHGHNGSGKSSFAEALELLLTNRVQRLDEGKQANYFFSIKYRSPGVKDDSLCERGSASATLKSGDKDIASVDVKPGGELNRQGRNPESSLRTNSFKIDQLFMDKLVRNDAVERLALFLDAFSPKESNLLATMTSLRTALRNAISLLPEHVRGSAPSEMAKQVEWVLREFGWIHPAEAKDTPAPGSAAQQTDKPENAGNEAFLPLPSTLLRRLSVMEPSFEEALTAVLRAGQSTALQSVLEAFEKSLGSLAPAVHRADASLRTTKRVLEEFRNWQADKRRVRGPSLKADLDSWLCLRALLDITTKKLHVENTVRIALNGGWQPAPHDSEILRADTARAGTEELAARAEQLTQETKDAHDRVLSWSQSETGPVAEQTSPLLRGRLFETEVRALDRAGQWLSKEPSEARLGQTFELALEEGGEQSWSDGVIGRPGGLDPLIVRTQEFLEVVEQFEKAAFVQPSKMFTNLSDMVRTARALQKITADLPATFFQRLVHEDGNILKDLLAAFNELLTFMTPARWKYRDINLIPRNPAADAPDENPMAATRPPLSTAAMEYKTPEGARADLFFNTAELNASALALFLLLAPRLPNPLRLLILDDPLQNMDELTVLTVGRAMGKLLRNDGVYPPGWSILAFFHGEQNVDRIREETQSVVYQLPWLHSSMDSPDDTIRPIARLSSWPSEVQILDQSLLEDRSPGIRDG